MEAVAEETRECKQGEQRKLGYKEGVEAQGFENMAVEQGMDGALGAAAGTVKSGKSLDGASREERPLCGGVKGGVDVDKSDSGDNDYRRYQYSVRSGYGGYGDQIEVLIYCMIPTSGKHIRPRSSEMRHHSRALCEQFSARSYSPR